MASEQTIHRRFEAETAGHAMTVLRDEGLYRHLRFSRPSEICYSFDLVTWPGYLAMVGDMGDYLFARTTDMFQFFESDSGRINPDYWSEKLQAPRGYRAVRVYSNDMYRERVGQCLAEHIEELVDEDADLREREKADALTAAVREQLLDGEQPFDKRAAIERLIDFEHDGFQFYEPYDWTLTEFDGPFLWCCHAIVWGIAQYRRAYPETEVAA